jgi:hypothetical protein
VGAEDLGEGERATLASGVMVLGRDDPYFKKAEAL